METQGFLDSLNTAFPPRTRVKQAPFRAIVKDNCILQMSEFRSGSGSTAVFSNDHPSRIMSPEISRDDSRLLSYLSQTPQLSPIKIQYQLAPIQRNQKKVVK